MDQWTNGPLLESPVVFPRPAADVVSVIWVDVSRMTSQAAEAMLPRLSADEVARFHRYRHPLSAFQFLAGRLLVRGWLAAVTGVAPSDWQIVEGPRGRPAIAHPPTDWSFNLAHSGGLVACALSLQSQIGVDLEHLDRRPMPPELFRRYCSPSEVADIDRQPEELRSRRFLTYWTLKEAYLKARGLGIAVPLAEVEFSVSGPQPAITFRGSLAGTDSAWAFALFQPTPRFLLSVAVPQPAGTTPSRVEVHTMTLEGLTSA